MMHRTFRYAWLVAGLTVFGAGPGHAQARGESATPTAPAPRDSFAYALPLTIDPDAKIQSVELPLDVYRQCQRADLGDLRVFNAAGHEVPHALLDPVGRVQAPEQQDEVLPHFALRGVPGAGSDLDGLRLHVERSSANRVVDIRIDGAPAQADDGPGRQASAYILTVPDSPQPLTSLSIELEASERGFILPMTVDASDDLEHWRNVTSAKTVARLQHGAQTIDRPLIEFPATQAKFLRLRWPGATLPASVLRVRAHRAPEHIAPAMATLEVQGQPRTAEPGSYDFDLGGGIPVEHVDLILPNDATLARARLSSRTSTADQFQLLFEGPVFRLSQLSLEVSTPTIKLPPGLAGRPHAQFELIVEARGGGLGEGTPTLVAHYHPQRLVFVARGQAPYEIVYGRWGTAPSHFSAREILGLVGETADPARAPASATPLQRVTLAGPSAFNEVAVPVSARTYLLWAVLLGGVAILAALVLRLLKTMKPAGQEPQ